jgi:hypothetical protein
MSTPNFTDRSNALHFRTISISIYVNRIGIIPPAVPPPEIPNDPPPSSPSWCDQNFAFRLLNARGSQ